MALSNLNVMENYFMVTNNPNLPTSQAEDISYDVLPNPISVAISGNAP